MDYFNTEALYKYFKDAIKRDSGVIIDQLRAEIDELKTKAENNIKSELLQEQTRQLTAKKEELNSEYQLKLSLEDNRIHHEIVQKRKQLIDDLFLKLENKLKQYIKSKEYQKKLLAALNGIDSNKYHLILVSNDDFNWINKEFKTIKVVANQDILAGFKAIAKDEKTILDYTYNEKIIGARNWFYEHATWFI